MDLSETAVSGDMVYPVKKRKPCKFNCNIPEIPPVYFPLRDGIQAESFMPNSSRFSFDLAFPMCPAFELGCLMLYFLEISLNSQFLFSASLLFQSSTNLLNMHWGWCFLSIKYAALYGSHTFF
jgi:hypothetical protein